LRGARSLGHLELEGRRKPYVMAHRGNRVLCPENTMAAFHQALVDGADIIETDLHLTADQEFVCIHDSTVDRTTSGSGAVAGMTLAQLQRLSASCGHPGFRHETVPTLGELASVLPNDVALALELKTDRFLEGAVCRRLVEDLARHGVRDRTVVLSFSLDRVRAIKLVAPDIAMGWITLWRAWPFREVQLIGPLWPMLLLNPLYVWLAHRFGQVVAPLDPTPDGRLWYYRLLGCDALLSDNPQLTVRRLGRASLVR
jgi:glycerophosphoryl diester phosphodiesterase